MQYLLFALTLFLQSNIVIDCGVQPSRHLDCHHQLVFAKTNLKSEYYALYERLIWGYKNDKNANIKQIKHETQVLIDRN